MKINYNPQTTFNPNMPKGASQFAHPMPPQYPQSPMGNVAVPTWNQIAVPQVPVQPQNPLNSVQSGLFAPQQKQTDPRILEMLKLYGLAR